MTISETDNPLAPTHTQGERGKDTTKLGEELPVFCERCGYVLHGLPMIRCEHCTLLQFHCPECGHHQPINTLRPAAQTLLGRIRGGWLALVVFFKLNLFGWLLFAWLAMGAAYSVMYDEEASQLRRQTQVVAPNMPPPFVAVWGAAKWNWETVLAFGLFGWPFGMVLRMALMRWKHGWKVGLVLATLAMGCIMLGVAIRRIDWRREKLPNPYNSDFIALMALAFGAIVFGAATVWPIWSLLVHAFLPKRTANALLNWQLSLSNQVSALSRPEALAISRRSVE
jgi:hypothetical protein